MATLNTWENLKRTIKRHDINNIIRISNMSDLTIISIMKHHLWLTLTKVVNYPCHQLSVTDWWVKTQFFGHVRSIVNGMTVLMISDLPLITIMFHDAGTLATEISSSNHDWSYLKQLVWLSSLLLEKHDLIWKVQPHRERSPFSPLSFLIHDPCSNFHTPTSLSCMKTQTARCKSLLLRRHLCKHFLLHQLHVPKHHFSDAHTHMLINTYETRFLCH